MHTKSIEFKHKGSNLKIEVALIDTAAEVHTFMDDNEIIQAANAFLLTKAKAAAIGRKPRTRRFVRLDLSDPAAHQLWSTYLSSLRTRGQDTGSTK